MDELEREYHVFHFTGHGRHQGILLEDSHGYADPVEIEWLERHFRKHDFRLAVINSCETAMTRILNADGKPALSRQFIVFFNNLNIPFTIGMQFSVQQKAGNDFMKSFYRSLLAGASFLEAIQEARERMVEQAVEQNFSAWQFLIPVAHVHPAMVAQADQRGLFALDSLELCQIHQPDLPHFSYRRNEQYTGRREELTKALTVLDPSHGTKIVMRQGKGGMGKTALAIELAFRSARWYPKVYWASGRKEAADSSLAASLEDREALTPTTSDSELYLRLAEEIGCEQGRTLTELIRNIHEALGIGPPALLILDNLENYRNIGNLHHLLSQLPGH